jgi:hypothetical protein
MKAANFVVFVVLLAVSQSVCLPAEGGQWWWPPSNVEISPQNPTCSDIIAITLSGEWPDGCIPNASSIWTYDNNIYFVVYCNYLPGTVCPTIITPWQRTESLCPRPLGRYTVYTYLVGVPGIGEEYTQIAEFIVTGRIFSRIIYVDTDANGANDGSSWENAYNFLQDALADAYSSPKPVEIRVAQGVYGPDEDILHPNGTGDRTATFQLINSVTLKGGYAGFGQPDPNKRDVGKYETILSGDLKGDDGPGFVNYDENSYHVLSGDRRYTGCSYYGAIVEGFTITGGNASGPDWYHKEGGGIYIYIDCELTVTNCTIIGNRAEYRGGGMLSVGSGGCPSTITNCRFIANNCDGGGGGLCLDGESIPYMTNCLFAGNSARWAGAISILEGYPRIRNCTFSGNTASDQCGGIIGHVSLLRNCILWANTDSSGNTESAQIQPGDYSHIDYCCIQGWSGSLDGTGNIDTDPCFAAAGYWDPNVTPDDANDDFWVDGDYHLKSQAGRWNPPMAGWIRDDVTSLCIDAGDPASPIGLEPFPNGGIINMGAYGGTAEASKSYFGEPVCETIVAGDINGDCIVNLKDLALMSYHWLEEH